MPFVEYHHMVEQLTPNAADKALRGSVLPWLRKTVRLGSISKLLIACVTASENAQTNRKRIRTAKIATEINASRDALSA